MSKVDNMELNASQRKNGAVISFHNLSYTVKVPQACFPCCRKHNEVEILKDVSGVMKQGLNAIMGPTGSGKSSLLDVLAKRKDPKWLQGKVLMNDQKLPSNYRYQCGYVVQNDILMGTLSVRECLWFSANLRLSTSVPHSEKKKRVVELLDQLGLEKCADTKIGNEIIRGVSGGERKRTSIGLELITKPSVLFLDEPTTGLDASTANVVMRLLKKLTLQGQTIVISIHQPRFSIFRLFDSLTLLSLGQCLYHGDAKEAIPYFEGIGYECETHNNPADFFLDVINGEVEANDQVDQIEFENEETKNERDVKITESLHKSFLQSENYKNFMTELKNIESRNSPNKVKTVGDGEQTYATSFLTQMKYLLARDVKNVIRNPQGLMGNVGINIIIGIVFGLLYFQVDNTPDTGTQNRFGLIFFIVTNLLFSSTNAVELFIQGRALFIHEHVSGYYRIVSYFLAKLTADLIPMRTVSPLFYSVTTYWMVGLKAEVGTFFIFILITTLVGYCAVAIAMFFAVTFQNFAVATLFMILIFVFSIVFSGLLVDVNKILSWLSWIKYLSVARYGMVGVSVNEFRGLTFEQCGGDFNNTAGLVALQLTTSTNDKNETCISITGEEFVHGALSVESSVEAINDWTLWQNVVALACISTGLLLLTYIQLVRSKKYS